MSTKLLRVCAVCGHGLSVVGPDPADPIAYVHPAGYGNDHPAVPVAAGAVPMNPICDMCNEPTSINEVYTWPCHDYPGNEGDWCLCPGCHVLAINGRWTELASNIIDKMVAKHGERNRPQITATIVHFHTRFRENRAGEPYRGVPVEYVNPHQ